MARKRIPGLSWIDPDNRSQQKWACEYLLERMHDIKQHTHLPNAQSYSYRDLISIGENFEHEIITGSEHGMRLEKFLQKMKTAWRGAASRQRLKSDGIRTVRICAESSRQLTNLASSSNMSEQAFLERLIARSFKSSKKHSEKKSQKPSASRMTNGPSYEQVQNHFQDRPPSPPPEFIADLGKSGDASPMEDQGTKANAPTSPIAQGILGSIEIKERPGNANSNLTKPKESPNL